MPRTQRFPVAAQVRTCGSMASTRGTSRSPPSTRWSGGPSREMNRHRSCTTWPASTPSMGDRRIWSWPLSFWNRRRHIDTRQEIHPSWVQRDPDLEWLRQSDAQRGVGACYQAFIVLLKGEDWPPEKDADGKVPLVSASTLDWPLTPESSDLPV